jgi:hypothetical protein
LQTSFSSCRVSTTFRSTFPTRRHIQTHTTWPTDETGTRAAEATDHTTTATGGAIATQPENATTTADDTAAAATTAGIVTETGTETAGGIAHAPEIGLTVGAHGLQAATEATTGGMPTESVNTGAEMTIGQSLGGSAGTGAYEGT